MNKKEILLSSLPTNTQSTKISVCFKPSNIKLMNKLNPKSKEEKYKYKTTKTSPKRFKNNNKGKKVIEELCPKLQIAKKVLSLKNAPISDINSHATGNSNSLRKVLIGMKINGINSNNLDIDEQLLSSRINYQNLNLNTVQPKAKKLDESSGMAGPYKHSINATGYDYVLTNYNQDNQSKIFSPKTRIFNEIAVKNSQKHEKNWQSSNIKGPVCGLNFQSQKYSYNSGYGNTSKSSRKNSIRKKIISFVKEIPNKLPQNILNKNNSLNVRVTDTKAKTNVIIKKDILKTRSLNPNKKNLILSNAMKRRARQKNFCTNQNSFSNVSYNSNSTSKNRGNSLSFLKSTNPVPLFSPYSGRTISTSKEKNINLKRKFLNLNEANKLFSRRSGTTRDNSPKMIRSNLYKNNNNFPFRPSNTSNNKSTETDKGVKLSIINLKQYYSNNICLTNYSNTSYNTKSRRELQKFLNDKRKNTFIETEQSKNNKPNDKMWPQPSSRDKIKSEQNQRDKPEKPYLKINNYVKTAIASVKEKRGKTSIKDRIKISGLATEKNSNRMLLNLSSSSTKAH